MFWRTKIDWARIGPNSPAAVKFGIHAVQGYGDLVLVPNDPASKKFVELVHKVSVDVTQEGVTERELNFAANQLSVAVEEFSQKQRHEIETSIAEVYWGLNTLLQALEGTVKCASTLEGEAEKSINQLAKLERVQSFEELQAGIKNEIATLKQAIANNKVNMLAARKVATDHLDDLRQKLGVAEQASRTDQLTQLGNRTAFEVFANDAISRSANDETWLAMIDLNRFKEINDSFGHLAGDAALAEVAVRLKERFDLPGCLATRLGGDEFAVIFKGPRVKLETFLFLTSESFQKKPLIYQGSEIPVGLSFGSARFLPERSLRDTQLLADSQMYSHKKSEKAAS